MSHDYRYPARVTADEFGRYRARFPDLPEVYAWGRSRIEALTAAEESLTRALSDRMEADEPIPMPSPVYDDLFLVTPAPRIIAAVMRRYGETIG